MSRPPQRQRPSQERRETYPLPEDTREMLEKVTGEPQNYGLRIDRLLLCNKETWEPTKRSKERFIPSKNGKKVFTFTDDVASILRACRARLEAILDAYRNAGWEVRSVTLRAASRVIVGLGAESVLETNLRLHRIYGFPIIPGSALKGLARAYAELVEGKNENDPLFADVFGKGPPDAQAGKVIFFDAIPANPVNLQLELDVMNPHYAPYYQGTEPPADYHNPVPVFFLTIGPESEFLFAVASCEEHLAEKAREWLTKALTEMGVGAKTVAGYGLWKEGQEASPAGSPTSELTTTASQGPGQKETSTKPGHPEVLKELPRKVGAQIPAKVVDNTSKPVKVRLLVEGYLDMLIPCSGIQNLEGFSRGILIKVVLSQRGRRDVPEEIRQLLEQNGLLKGRRLTPMGYRVLHILEEVQTPPEPRRERCQLRISMGRNVERLTEWAREIERRFEFVQVLETIDWHGEFEIRAALPNIVTVPVPGITGVGFRLTTTAQTLGQLQCVRNELEQWIAEVMRR